MQKEILKNKIIRNGIWLYLLQFFNTVIPFITIPYITRILGKETYGVLSKVLNIVGYLQVLIEYGFAMSASREIAISKQSNDRISSIFTNVFYSRLALMIMSIVLAGVYLFISKADLLIVQCLMIMIICLFGYCIQTNWLFHGMQEMKYVSLVNIISRSTATILIFLLVKDKNDLLLYCLLYTVSPLLSGVLGFLIARKKYRIRFVRINFDSIIEKLQSGWYVFTTQMSSKVFGSIGVTFLGLFATNAEVGVFSAIQKIPHIMMLAWSPISQIIYPIASKKMSVGFNEGFAFVKKLQTIFVGGFSVFAILIGVFSKLIIRIGFGQEYLENYYWIIPMLLWVIISINNNFMGVQTLLSSSHDKEYSKCFQIGVLLTIGINYILIFFWGGNGASIAPVIAETALSILLFREIVKIRKNV